MSYDSAGEVWHAAKEQPDLDNGVGSDSDDDDEDKKVVDFEDPETKNKFGFF